jgi:histidinol phosphatase-like enzyme
MKRILFIDRDGVILQEPPQRTAKQTSSQPALCLISGQSRTALQSNINRLLGCSLSKTQVNTLS